MLNSGTGHKSPTAHSLLPGRRLQTMAKPIFIEVKVKPNARFSMLEQTQDGSWVAQIKAAPVDGKANDELIALVARQFRCPKSAVSIKSGASGRTKRIRIQSD